MARRSAAGREAGWVITAVATGGGRAARAPGRCSGQRMGTPSGHVSTGTLRGGQLDQLPAWAGGLGSGVGRVIGSSGARAEDRGGPASGQLAALPGAPPTLPPQLGAQGFPTKPASWGPPKSAQTVDPGPLKLRPGQRRGGADPAPARGGAARGALLGGGSGLLDQAGTDVLAFAAFLDERLRALAADPVQPPQGQHPIGTRPDGTLRRVDAPTWSAAPPTVGRSSAWRAAGRRSGREDGGSSLPGVESLRAAQAVVAGQEVASELSHASLWSRTARWASVRRIGWT